MAPTIIPYFFRMIKRRIDEKRKNAGDLLEMDWPESIVFKRETGEMLESFNT